MPFNRLKQLGQRIWRFVGWVFETENLPKFPRELFRDKMGENFGKAFLKWVLEPETLPEVPLKAQEEAPKFISWVLAAEDLPTVRPTRELDGLGGKQSSFIKWLFSSEELPRITSDSASKYNKSFIHWLLEGENLPEHPSRKKEHS